MSITEEHRTATTTINEEEGIEKRKIKELPTTNRKRESGTHCNNNNNNQLASSSAIFPHNADADWWKKNLNFCCHCHCCCCCSSSKRKTRKARLNRCQQQQQQNHSQLPMPTRHHSFICRSKRAGTTIYNNRSGQHTESEHLFISSNGEEATVGAGIRPEKTYCTLLKENTTFHGIRDMIQTAGLLRTIWVCIIVLASLAALVGCGMIVWEFNTRPLSVTFGIKENGSLVLPDIIICPFNRFNHTFLASWNVSDQLAQYLELAFPASSQHPFQYKSYKSLLDQMDALEVELAELLERVGMSFTEFIQKSSINCRAFFLNKSLCDTAQELMTMVGKCFRILGEEQRNDGHGHAQRIIVRTPVHLYNPAPNQMMNDGILVKLAERGKGIDHDMSFVPSGVHAIFPLTATRFEFIHYPPHFLCREQDDPTYSPTLCFEKCFLDKAERECNCSLAAAAQPGTLNTCTPRQFFNCVYGVLRFDDANAVDEEVAHCKSRCLPPCRNWRFDKTVTYAHFPSAGARHFVKDESKWEELRNTIILEVFYTTLDYTIIQQMLTITPSSFVAQLGGKLGGQISLWIGGSIISLMQLVIYLLSYLCVYFRRTNGKVVRQIVETKTDKPIMLVSTDDEQHIELECRRRSSPLGEQERSDRTKPKVSHRFRRRSNSNGNGRCVITRTAEHTVPISCAII